jgi:hypothetical protein
VTNGVGCKQKWAIVLLREKTLLKFTGCPLRCQLENKPSQHLQVVEEAVPVNELLQVKPPEVAIPWSTRIIDLH